MGEVKFSDMVLPENKLVTYVVDLKRVILRKLVLGVGESVIVLATITFPEGRTTAVNATTVFTYASGVYSLGNATVVSTGSSLTTTP